MRRNLFVFLSSTLALLFLNSCTAVDHMVRSIPTPSITGIRDAIPGLGVGDSVGSKDPLVQFSPQMPLAPGHTLRLAVYDGSRTARLLHEGLVMVDNRGVIEFKNVGSARVGGHSAADAQVMIQSVFRAAGRAGSRVHVHLISIENTPLVTVEGDVARPLVLALTKRLSVADAIAYAGGRRRGSTSRSLYVSHEGQRSFYTTVQAATAASKLKPGDIIELSSDL